jgi:colanic acid biosynthesis protein WcaH
VTLDDAAFLEVVRNAPLVSIDLIVENPAGEVLLGLRNNEPARGSWFVPGGSVRKGERLADAFARVARGELGLSLRIGDARLLGVFEHLYDTNFAGAPGVGTHYVVLAYRVALPDGDAPRADAQHGAFRWWPWDRVREDPAVHPNTRPYAGPAREG